MATKHLVDQDTGVTTIFHDDGDRVALERVQDVSAIVEANKRALNDASGRMGEFQHVGRIPIVVLERWMKEDGINYLDKDNTQALLKKLELRDNRLFKTHPGKFA